jgi:hypothetical protein
MRKCELIRVLIEVYCENVPVKVLKPTVIGHGQSRTREHDDARIGGLSEPRADTPFMLMYHKGGAT